MHGTINKQPVYILVDDGATHNFLNYNLVKNFHLLETSSTHTYVISMMNVGNKDVWDTVVKEVDVEVQGHPMHLHFQVMHMSQGDDVLGRERFHALGPSLKRSYEHNTLAFEVNGTHVLLMGEQNIPPSSLICTTKLSYLEKHEEIKELYFCYVLPISLQSSDVNVNDDKFVCINPSFFIVRAMPRMGNAYPFSSDSATPSLDIPPAWDRHRDKVSSLSPNANPRGVPSYLITLESLLAKYLP